MHTKLDRSGAKTTVVNASDLKILRAAREMVQHAKDNVPELADVSPDDLGRVVSHFAPSKPDTAKAASPQSIEESHADSPPQTPPRQTSKP